nr:hypothetical protein [Chloroflexaceae bacterium]
LVPGERVNIASRRGILHEPALLMAPDISDTRDVVMVPILPEVLEAFGVGVRPTRAETQRLITTSSLFGLTALLSFSNDTLAGTESGPPETSDVAWFAQLLRARFGERFLHREIPGDHLQPTGIRVGDTVYAPDLRTVLDKDPIPRQLETVALEFLTELHTRIGSAAPTLRSAPTGTWVGAV